MNGIAPTLTDAIEAAEQLWKKGELAAAFDAYHEGIQLSLQSTGGRSAADLVVLERFADLAVLVGRTDSALWALSVMADLCAAGGNEYGEDYATLKAVLVAHQGGQVAHARGLMYSRTERFGNLDAIRFESASLDGWEATVDWPATDADDRAVMFALFYLAASRLTAMLGQYADAMQAARRGIVHAARETPLAQRYRAPLQLAEALAAVQSGELTRGSDLLDGLATSLDPRRDPGLHFHWLELSAKLAMLRGEFGSAVDGLRKAVDQSRPWPARVQIACLRNLAAFEILINQTANAEQTLDRAESLATRFDRGSMISIAQLRAMAGLRARSFADDAAHSVSSAWDAEEEQAAPVHSGERIQQAVGQPADFLEWFEQRALDFQFALGDARLTVAADMFNTINQTFASTDSEIVHLRMAYLDALLRYYQGHYGRAQAILAALKIPLERSGLVHDLWQAQRLTAWIARRIASSKADVEAAVLAEDSTLQRLAGSLDPIARAIFLLNKWTSEEEAIASLTDATIAAQGRLHSRFAPLRWWRTLQCCRKALTIENRLEAGKRALARSAIGASLETSRATRLLDVWRQSRDEAHLTFSALPDRLVAIVRCRGVVRVHLINVSRIALRQSVKRWHERVLATPASPINQEHDVLADGLAQAVRSLPAGVRQLRIHPDDALHGYPFAALMIDGMPLVERCTISIGHTGARIPRASHHRAAVVLAANQPLENYPALPHAAGEVQIVGDLLARLGFDVTRLTGAAAGKTAATGALERAAVVHVACHGRFRSDQPESTGLVLAGDDGKAATLSIADIGRLDGSRLEHVTLSACWSADNFVVPGRWIFSLPETLCRAGAHSVLASLWEVDDRVAAAFMQRFYADLSHFSRADALREVQQACLHNQLCPGVDTSDPLFWAGFYLFGDPRRLPCN
jgi:CHAT domain-containing protein